MSFLDRMESDLAVFINTNDFGEEALYTPHGEDARTISVIFNDAYEGLNMRTHVTMGTTGPFALVRDADISANPTGDTLTVRTKEYNIVDANGDGTGITKLILSTDNEC